MLVKKYIIKMRSDAGESTANVVFEGANDPTSICQGGVSTCTGVTVVGSTGFRVSGTVGSNGTAPTGPTQISGLPQATTLTYGILLW